MGAADTVRDGCALAELVEAEGGRFPSGVFDSEGEADGEGRDADEEGEEADAAALDVIAGSACTDDGSVVGLSDSSSTMPETVPTVASSACRNGCFFLTG
ncbi:hypothetical protein ADL12_48305 [Streptomyces regalis]|uniref:Uncharacterized protein n=1 Tax=Streptomyces regalis TaxID=68262 RepID=A0A117MJF9_9ACTN|nr:hypothetical protein ADL12_48305 [Streptomyces regalis]